MLLRLLILLQAVVYAIYLGWPMDEQLPNVARVNQPYEFTIAYLTYRSNSGGSISYSVTGLPSWLSFDQSSRTFSGTPSESDVASFEITLTGKDDTDASEMSRNYTMLVSNSTGIQLSSDDVMFPIIAQYGRTNGRGGLVLSEGEDFDIKLSEDIFEEKNGSSRPIIAYYGRSQDRTSLPSWISFNADDLSFSGTVPYVTSDIAPSSEYGFSFLASDYYGFSGAEAIFKILVGAHDLSTSLNESVKINGTFGADFHYEAPILSSVYLDGNLINKSNISSVATNDLPSYVTFNKDDYTLSGVFPNSSRSDNFSIVVSDFYGNTVDLPYRFDSIGSVFTLRKLPDVNATKGEFFEYQIMKSFFTDFNDTEVSVSLSENDNSWLSYVESNMTLVGKAPSDLNSVKVKIQADSSYDSESRTFSVRGIDKEKKPTNSSSTSSTQSTPTSRPSASSTSSNGADEKSKSGNHSRKALILGLSIGLPCFFLVLALLLLFFLCCRRKKRQDEEENEKSMEDTFIERPENLDDHTETPHQLGALNALKLDNDSASTSSSVTHVDSDSTSRYFDASEKPMKSWRAKDESDLMAVKNKLMQRHASEISNSTVNTEELFAVRLVDDETRRSASQSPFFSRDSLDQHFRESGSSANIERLDSDGNIVPTSVSNTSSPRKRAAQSMSLNNINEEDNAYRGGDNKYQYGREESEEKDLMAKYFSGKTSSIDADDFKVVKTPVGNYEWRSSKDALVASPDSETFLLNNPEHTPVNSYSTTAGNNASKTSVYSDDLQNDKPLGAGKTLNGQAKLVEFTRKGSLRDSSHTPTMEFSGETAQIHDGSSAESE
ncbi:hypothetical protein FDK38_004011 [Candidozyma auris]|nr:hypothetical protein FDK38_004011 [[Candida] auris]